jgi:hypothetical protein
MCSLISGTISRIFSAPQFRKTSTSPARSSTSLRIRASLSARRSNCSSEVSLGFRSLMQVIVTFGNIAADALSLNWGSIAGDWQQGMNRSEQDRGRRHPQSRRRRRAHGAALAAANAGEGGRSREAAASSSRKAAAISISTRPRAVRARRARSRRTRLSSTSRRSSRPRSPPGTRSKSPRAPPRNTACSRSPISGPRRSKRPTSRPRIGSRSRRSSTPPRPQSRRTRSTRSSRAISTSSPRRIRTPSSSWRSCAARPPPPRLIMGSRASKPGPRATGLSGREGRRRAAPAADPEHAQRDLRDGGERILEKEKDAQQEEALGKISKAKLLQLEKQFENQLYQIDLAGLQSARRRSIRCTIRSPIRRFASRSSNSSASIRTSSTNIDRQAESERTKIARQAISAVAQNWGQNIGKMLTLQESFSAGVKDMWQGPRFRDRKRDRPDHRAMARGAAGRPDPRQIADPGHQRLLGRELCGRRRRRGRRLLGRRALADRHGRASLRREHGLGGDGLYGPGLVRRWRLESLERSDGDGPLGRNDHPRQSRRRNARSIQGRGQRQRQYRGASQQSAAASSISISRRRSNGAHPTWGSMMNRSERDARRWFKRQAQNGAKVA